MVQGQPTSTPGFSTEVGGATGATMRPIYMGRTMNTYPVTDSEITTISMLNTESTIFFAVATLLLGFTASIWTNAIFYTDLTAEGKVASHYVAPGMLILAGVFVSLGLLAACRRMSLWRRIRRDSYPIQVAVPAATISVPVKDGS